MSSQPGSRGDDDKPNLFADFINGTDFDEDVEAYLKSSKKDSPAPAKTSTTAQKEVPKEEPKPITKTCTGSDFDAKVRRMSANEVTEDEAEEFNAHCDTCPTCGPRRMKLMGNLRSKPTSY